MATYKLSQVDMLFSKYKQDFKSKHLQFITRLANEGFSITNRNCSGFSDDVTVSIKVIPNESDYVCKVFLSGKDVAFIEFGTGVTYNTGAGGSLHPKGVELGMTIGSYGKGRGKNPNGWWYKPDGSDHALHSYGNPAFMPLYKAFEEVKEKISTIVKEIYGGQ